MNNIMQRKKKRKENSTLLVVKLPTRFSSSCWPCGTRTHRHIESLSESDVASIGKRCDNQTLCATDELVLVLEIDICNGNEAGVGVLQEIEPDLFQPLEVVRRFDMHLYLFLFFFKDGRILILAGEPETWCIAQICRKFVLLYWLLL